MKTLNCMLQVGPSSLHYYCAVVLHSYIVLPPVGHSSNHEYHCCQLTIKLCFEFLSHFQGFHLTLPHTFTIHRKSEIGTLTNKRASTVKNLNE
jgi:hypothetical protein